MAWRKYIVLDKPGRIIREPAIDGRRAPVLFYELAEVIRVDDLAY
jgi:hypothetical protein